MRRENVIGRRVTEIFPGVKRFGIFEVFQRVWRTGQQEYFPEGIYQDDRDPGTWRESWVYKLPGDEIVAVYNDITVRKQSEKALEKAYAGLEDKVKERTMELQTRLTELERFRNATVEREFRMKELCDEIERLKAEKNK